MSDNLNQQFQQLTNEELIDFALDYVASQDEAIRKAALQEHFSRVKNADNTIVAPPGDVQILQNKMSQLISNISGSN